MIKAVLDENELLRTVNSFLKKLRLFYVSAMILCIMVVYWKW